MTKISELLGEEFASHDGVVPFEGEFGQQRCVLTREDMLFYVARLAEIINGHARIGILSNQRIETYLAVVGSVMAGITFVPLNPKFPSTRLQTILELANVDFILTDDSTELIHHENFSNVSRLNVSDLARTAVDDSQESISSMSRALQTELNSDDFAYLMFTSGSTGVPKGVPVSYGNLASYIAAISDVLRIGRGLRFTQFFDLSFDLSIHDIFLSQYLGGTLVAPKPIDLVMPQNYLNRENINVWFSVPVLGALLGRSKKKAEYSGLQHMLFCGEALPIETVIACRPHLAPTGRMWNLYGPTEATIAFTAADVTHTATTEGVASIGLPFGRNRVALHAAEGIIESPKPGDEGELLLGGPQVFQGYSTDVPLPFVVENDNTYYKSGDLVRIAELGIEYRGRVDSQVKWRGYRIELGEIETAIRAEFELKTVAVVLTQGTDDPVIVAWCLRDECTRELNLDQLNERLPSYMIPHQIVQLDAMPLNVNGKIDRLALSKMEIR